MEMHIVHKKVGLTVEEALSTSDGLAVVGQMFQVAQLCWDSINSNFEFQITDEDNEVLTPLIESLANIENFNDKFDMIDSPLKVKFPDQKIFLDCSFFQGARSAPSRWR